MSSYSQRSLAILLLSLISFVGSGCGLVLTPLSRVKAKDHASNQHASKQPTGAPDRPVVPNLLADASTNWNAFAEYGAQIRLYLDQEKFDQIDAIADIARAGKLRFSGGAWKLHKLYQGLCKPANSRIATDDLWLRHIAHLKKWTELKPESITARVGLAEAYTEYAWHARGTGFASTVKEDSWEVFEQRIAMAEKILNGAKKFKAKCPHWYDVMQTVALGQHWESDRYDALFEEAIRFEPDYHYFYSTKAQYLLPRWYGEEGDWERFADDVYKRLKGKDGSIIYYVIASDLAYYYKDRTFFTDTQIDWPRMKQGFADMEERYGTSMRNLNDFCRIAGQSGEKAFTRSLLARIGDNWDPETWTNKEYFEHYKAWANSAD
ncbi:MAG: hypothetical protein ABR501_13520 [Pyrinomonadaceae bacterium]